MLHSHTIVRVFSKTRVRVFSLESKQCAFLLLEYSTNSRIAHITRFSLPDHTKDATCVHDAMIDG